jgi:uncharacterized phage-associated protein
MDLGVKLNIDKITSLILLLAERVPKLYLTKLLKLLYIIDETAVSETGVPVTWLKYRVWKRGPVAKYIFNEVKFYDGKSFSDRIGIEKNEYGLLLNPFRKFENTEFSKYELDLIERIISVYSDHTSEELVDFTHRENGLWSKAVKENNLQDKFDEEDNTSPFSIDFKELIKDDPLKLIAYESAKEALYFRAEIGEFNEAICE